MRLIAFNGQMGCGKSTAIASLETALGFPPTLVKFAGVLYEMQETLYKMIEPVYKRPPGFIKDRKLLQWLGTEWGRGLDQDLWVSIWINKVSTALERGEYVVCDDVRYDNEAEIVKSLGGTIIKITSNRAAERIDTSAGIKNHSSEGGINEKFIDFTIANDGSLQHYETSLADLYRKLDISGR
jgi:hypothetical protein